MDDTLTPDAVRLRVARCLMTMQAFLKRAKVGATTFARWDNGEGAPRPLTLAKIEQALAEIEAERTNA